MLASVGGANTSTFQADGLTHNGKADFLAAGKLLVVEQPGLQPAPAGRIAAFQLKEEGLDHDRAIR